MEKRGAFISLEMNRKAQFYIIAAVIIAVLLAGLATTVNYAVTSATPTKFYDLGEAYGLETSKVIDYGVYQKYSPGINISEKIENFTQQFFISSSQKDPNIGVVYIYGDANKATVINYAKNTTAEVTSQEGTQKIEAADVTSFIKNIITSETQTQTAVTQTKISKTTVTPTTGGKLTVNITGQEYNFNLGAGQNFYFIVRTTKPSGEVNVVTK